MKKVLLAFSVLIISISSCSKHADVTSEKSSAQVQSAIKQFNADITKFHPDLGEEDRALLSQYVISHIMRGEDLPKNLIIEDAIKEQKIVNKSAGKIR